MQQEFSALVLVRNEGSPTGKPDKIFEQLTSKIKYKQQRLLFFEADPINDQPEQGVTLRSFYDVDFSSVELPVLMLVSGSERKITVIQSIKD